METPNKLFVALKNQDFLYPIADISFGICDNDRTKKCYIYSIMKPKDSHPLSKEEEHFHKKIKRLMYKINNAVKDSDNIEYMEYKNSESSYYPESILDVTPSFVLALTAFTSLLLKEGINEIKVASYLPLRYFSRELAAETGSADKRKEREERNKIIQENSTNKFIRTFMRLKYHLKNLKVLSYPYETDEYLSIYIDDNNITIDNSLLREVSEAIEKSERRRKTK